MLTPQTYPLIFLMLLGNQQSLMIKTALLLPLSFHPELSTHDTFTTDAEDSSSGGGLRDSSSDLGSSSSFVHSGHCSGQSCEGSDSYLDLESSKEGGGGGLGLRESNKSLSPFQAVARAVTAVLNRIFDSKVSKREILPLCIALGRLHFAFQQSIYFP